MFELTKLAEKMLKERYFYGEEKTYEDLVDRMLSVLPEGQEKRKQILKEGFLNGYIVPATPNLTNLGTADPEKNGRARGLSISCFVSEFDDNMPSIINTIAHNSALSSLGGGVGTSFDSIREIGSPIKNNGTTGGVFPFLNIQASASIGVNQGGTRGGATVVHMDIDHPEIEEFIRFRLVEEGSAKDRKFPRLNHTVGISDKFMNAVLTNSDFDLISRYDGSVVKTVNAFNLFMDLLEVRFRRGEPNIIFTDTIKKNKSEVYKAAGVNATQSNLCFTGDMLLHTSLGMKSFKELYDSQADFDVIVDDRTELYLDEKNTVNTPEADYEHHNLFVNEIVNKDFLKISTKSIKPSTKVILTKKNAEIFDIELENGTILSSTSYHKYYIVRGDRFCKLPLSSLKIGDKLLSDPELEYSEDNTIVIKDIRNGNRTEDVYDVAQPETHSLIVNGVSVGNCLEILLQTAPDLTAVCCLGSINLVHWDTIKDNYELIEAFMYFLDCSLNETVKQINLIEDEILKANLQRVVKFIETDRSIGVGVMGYHSYLQSKNIPIETPMAKGMSINIFSKIKEHTDKANRALAIELGACPLAAESGILARFSNTTAIAPTASISHIVGSVSPGIDPILSNYHSVGNEEGYSAWRNPSLEKVIKSYAEENALDEDWIEEQWSFILKDEGSVQNLEWMDDWTKDVFKTAYEIDSNWIVELAVARQQYVDQAQSTNLFFKSDTHIRTLFNIHVKAWHENLKTLYYCRTEAASRASDTGKGLTVDTSIEEESLDYNECMACQ